MISEVDWTDALSDDNVNKNVENLYLKLHDIFQQYVPKHKNRKTHSKPWISPALARLRNKRRKAGRRAAATRSETDKADYVRLNDEFLDANSAAYASYVKRQGEKLRSKPKEFWNFIKDKRQCNGLPSTMTWRNTTANDPVSTCNLFNNFFGGIYARHDHYNEEAAQFSPASTVDDTVDTGVTEAEVLKLLRELDGSKGAGPDEIAPIFWKNAAKAIAAPLAAICNKSLTPGVFPETCKNGLHHSHL